MALPAHIAPDGRIFQPPSNNAPPGNELSNQIASILSRLNQAELDIRELRNIEFVDGPARERLDSAEEKLEELYPTHNHDWSHITSGVPTTWTAADHGNERHTPDFSDVTHTHAYSSLTSIPSSFTPSSHTHAYGTLTGIPSTFAPSLHDNTVHNPAYAEASHNHSGVYSDTSHTHAYSSLSSIPSTFPPSSHQHGWASGDITSIPSTFAPSNHGNTAHVPDFAADSDYLGLKNAYNGHTHSYRDDYNGSGGFTDRTTTGNPTPTW